MQKRTGKSKNDQSHILRKIGHEKICSNIEILLNFLGVEDYRIVGNKVMMPCPIHGGDNPHGCAIFLDGEKCCGNWMCFTHGCHINGGHLSDFVNFFNKTIDESIFDNTIVEKKITSKPRKKDDSVLCSIEELYNLIKIPSLYYVKRGYSRYILNRYKVGFCNNPNSSMYMRTVVPVFDLDGKEIIGALGRSVFEKCPKCKCYHGAKKECPEDDWKRAVYSKWKNTKFNPSQHLYNFWNAKNHIDDSIILVEGPGDVWRLEEAGIKNSVAIFGCILKPHQIQILLDNNIKQIIACLDMDEAGRKGLEVLKKKNMFNIIEPILPKKDVGSMTKNEILSILKDINE